MDEITQRIAAMRSGQNRTTRLLDKQTQSLVQDMLHNDTEVNEDAEAALTRRRPAHSRRGGKTKSADPSKVELSALEYGVTITTPRPREVSSSNYSRPTYDSDSDHSATVRSIRRPGRHPAAAGETRLSYCLFTPSSLCCIAFQQQHSRYEEAWQVLCEEKYVQSSFSQELKAILDDVGVFGPVDLADVGCDILTSEILPLLKLAPRNRIVRLLSIPEDKVHKGSAHRCCLVACSL